VNETGLTLGLANLYPPVGVIDGVVATGVVTRGRIIDDLLAAASEDEAVAMLQAMNLRVFAPFTLAVLERGQPPSLHRWDGASRTSRRVTEPGLVLTSSGAGRGVEEIRREEYARMAPGNPPQSEAIEALHRSHLDRLGPDSFCVHREEARTASLTRVEAGPESIGMIYVPGPPCTTLPLAPVTLPGPDVESGPPHSSSW